MARVTSMVTPYTKTNYPQIEGNDRVYFDEQFTAIERSIRSIIECLGHRYLQASVAGGVVTVQPSSNPILLIEVDTEGQASSDDVDTINGGMEGQVAIVKSRDNSRT